jgi:hypothetical protein
VLFVSRVTVGLSFCTVSQFPEHEHLMVAFVRLLSAL